jgi:hypothetical protein
MVGRGCRFRADGVEQERKGCGERRGIAELNHLNIPTSVRQVIPRGGN